MRAGAKRKSVAGRAWESVYLCVCVCVCACACACVCNQLTCVSGKSFWGALQMPAGWGEKCVKCSLLICTLPLLSFVLFLLPLIHSALSVSPTFSRSQVNRAESLESLQRPVVQPTRSLSLIHLLKKNKLLMVKKLSYCEFFPKVCSCGDELLRDL